eukprot:scaffold29688_cov78-Skeletonema_dohrnii-CCMP3373.AAC.1
MPYLGLRLVIGHQDANLHLSFLSSLNHCHCVVQAPASTFLSNDQGKQTPSNSIITSNFITNGVKPLLLYTARSLGLEIVKDHVTSSLTLTLILDSQSLRLLSCNNSFVIVIAAYRSDCKGLSSVESVTGKETVEKLHDMKMNALLMLIDGYTKSLQRNGFKSGPTMRSVHVGRMGRQRSANNATCNQAPSVCQTYLEGVVHSSFVSEVLSQRLTTSERKQACLICPGRCRCSGGGWMEASHDDRVRANWGNQLLLCKVSKKPQKILTMPLTNKMKQATPKKQTALQKEEERDDIAELIYQESQFRKREAAAAAAVSAAIKKGSHAGIARRRSSRLASAAITAARDAKLIATVKKEVTAKSRKRLCSEEDDVVPKKVARKQYRNQCSADTSVGVYDNDEANVKVELCTNEGLSTRGQSGEAHGRPWAKKLGAIKGCTKWSQRKGGVCKSHGAEFKLCSTDGCTNIAKGGGVCLRHGAKRYICSSVGCTNVSYKGGACKRHGAKVKVCSADRCTNQSFKGGVCQRHGAKVPRCRTKGCPNGAVQGGVCVRHGAQTKRCSHDGCTNRAYTGGVCIRHGAKVRLCSFPECTNQVKMRGVCIKHGAKVKGCSFEGCTKYSQEGGVCFEHGAQGKLCSSSGCTSRAKVGGLCYKHGAKRYICSAEGCTKLSIQGGVCIKHGAQGKPPCSVEGCTNKSVNKGVCQRHGAKIKRCSMKGCTNQVVKGGVCRRHGAKQDCSADECTNHAKSGGVCIRHGATVAI